MRFPLRALVSLLVGLALGCGSGPAPEEGSTDSELRTLLASEKIGDLAFGQTTTVAYSDQPLYRALRVSAQKGDLIDVWVRSSGLDGLDAKAWIVAASGKTLTSNDDADASTKDAHAVATAAATGDYYVVFREKNGEDGNFTVTLRDRTVPAPTPTESAPSGGLASLPDGTYRIPTTSFFNPIGGHACHEHFQLYTVVKQGDTISVGSASIGGSALTGVGTAASGRFHGQVTYSSCSYCPNVPAHLYTLDGSLKYENGKLSLVGESTTDLGTRDFSGSIATTLFGQDESTLPPGAHRSTITLGPRVDGCGALWSVTLVRLADGTRMMSLPKYAGDVDASQIASLSCALRPAALGLQGNDVYTYQSGLSATCSDSAPAPAWFVE